MDKNRSIYTSSTSPDTAKETRKESIMKARGGCNLTACSSHTQYYRMPRYGDTFQRITTNEYLDISESISGSSDTFNCVHGSEGKQYTEAGLLKRNILKVLDPIPMDRKSYDKCEPAYGWDMARTLSFLVSDPVGDNQLDRLLSHLTDFVKISKNGFRVDLLDHICTLIDYLVENYPNKPCLREPLKQIMKNMDKPILLNVASDVVSKSELIREYLEYMCYLLVRLGDDDLFELAAKAFLWQLSTPDNARGKNAVSCRYVMQAVADVAIESVVRMLAIAAPKKFSVFLDIGLLLASDNAQNCIEMIKQNILENIFYRFNPYFPDSDLQYYDINPADLRDHNIKLGASSLYITTVLSVLLVILKTTKNYVEENSTFRKTVPCPENGALRCFIWAYRYECRAPEHGHERTTLTVVAMLLLHVFGARLELFSDVLMADVLSLAVLTEIPLRSDWIRTVNFHILQLDVQFKKMLIYFSVQLLKVFPYNRFQLEHRYWLLGLIYLLDPGLTQLRTRWAPSLFAELRKSALQALVCTLHLVPHTWTKDYGLIRRLMWYIEWYSENPFEISVLYWCLRVLQVAISHRQSPSRKVAIKDLYDTHGIIILMHLCNTLLLQKMPPVERSQVVLALCLRMITSSLEVKGRVNCYVYPYLRWPGSLNSLARKMLDTALFVLEKHYIVSDRWLISMLNFIWESVIWNDDNREIFIANNGIYKLLDLITMSRAPVQCVALALVCDATRAGNALGQLVSWRANLGAANTHPNVVKRGSTIAGLMAAIFKDECQVMGILLDENGIIQAGEDQLMTLDVKYQLPSLTEVESRRSPICLAAADLAGCRISKIFAILHMLSEDLAYRVSIADEAYHLYQNIKLAAADEAVLVLLSHYMTMKLNQVWLETEVQCRQGLVPEDQIILEEFLHISRYTKQILKPQGHLLLRGFDSFVYYLSNIGVSKGWTKEVRRQQDDVLDEDRKKEHEEERTLYSFIGRVRLNIALDALREIRCVARSADRDRVAHALLYDAVRAHHRRSVMVQKLAAPVLRTYGGALDDQNITGQHVKVISIHPKDKIKRRDIIPS